MKKESFEDKILNKIHKALVEKANGRVVLKRKEINSTVARKFVLNKELTSIALVELEKKQRFRINKRGEIILY